MQEGLLLRGDGSPGFRRVEAVHGHVHGIQRLGELPDDDLEGLLLASPHPGTDPVQEHGDVVPQPLLGEGDVGEIRAPLGGDVALPVPHQVEGGGQDLLLDLHEGALVRGLTGSSSAPAATPSALLGGGELLGEPANREEVDVAQDLLGPGDPVVVPGHGVVRDHVTGYEVPLLEEQRVAGGDVGRRRTAPPTDQPDRVFGRSVDGVDQVQALDAVVVLSPHLEEDLLDGAGLAVPAGLLELHQGGLVGEEVDGVVGRSGAHPTVGPLELHHVSPFPAHRHLAGQEALLVRRQGHLAGVVQHQAPPVRGDRRSGPELDPGPGKDGDVSSVLHGPGLEARVAGEVIHHLQAIHIGNLGHVDGEGRRTDTGRANEIADGLVDVEHHPLEATGLARALHGGPVQAVIGEHGSRVDDVAIPVQGDELHLAGLESEEACGHELVGSLGDGDVSGLHLDGEGGQLLGLPVGEEEGRGPVAEGAGSQEEEEDTQHAHAGQDARIAVEERPVDPLPVLHVPGPVQGVGDETDHQGIVGILRLFHGGEDRRLQGRLVLLEVEGHLLVGDPVGQGTDHVDVRQDGDRQVGENPKGHHRRGRESGELESVGGDDEGHQPRSHQDGQAPEERAETPAVAYPADHVQKLLPVASPTLSAPSVHLRS